jgi:hypothetical protein
MIESARLTRIMSLFGMASEDLHKAPTVLETSEEILPYIVVNGALDGWTATQAALTHATTTVARPLRRACAQRPDPDSAAIGGDSRAREELFDRMLDLIVSAQCDRLDGLASSSGIIGALANLPGQGSLESRLRGKPRSYIVSASELTRAQPAEPASGQVDRNLGKILAVVTRQPSWWRMMPKVWRTARLRRSVEQRGLFDGVAYLKRYKDVASSGMDPLQHYIYYGVSEGRVNSN